MPRQVFAAVLLAATVFAPGAGAFMIVPAEDAPGGYVVVVETALGDHVPLSSLPRAYRNPADPAWREGLGFRWDYFRSSEEGRALLAIDGAGKAALSVEFTGPDLAGGDTIAMALVFVDGEGAALHTVYATATVVGREFAGGGSLHLTKAAVSLDGGAWGKVAGLTVFTMKYYAIQRLDEAGVRGAMRRAVARVTRGGESEQWLGDAGRPDG